MKVLLTTLNAKYIHTNLAIRLLFQLNKQQEGLAWKEFTIKEDAYQIALECAKYDVVAFSCYIWNITPTLKVAEWIKKINPTTKVLLGGPEVSYEYEQIIALDYIDYIIVGEGEIPFSAFLAHFPLMERVAGIVYKSNGQIVYRPNETAFELKQLDHINPYIDDEIATLQHRVLYIETSRGCPYKCAFCLASLDNKVRYLSNERIKENLHYLMQYGRIIKFLDRTFNVKKDFTIDIFQYILLHHKKGNVFQFEITADILHPDIISFIQAHVPAGLIRFEIGIQTVNKEANLAVSRKQHFEKTKSVIHQISDHIELHLDLIVGLPLDYWSDVMYSIEEVLALHPPELQLGFLKFLKGTPMRQQTDVHEYRYEIEPPYQLIQSKYLSSKELKRITALEFALEMYWNKKRLLHSLRYMIQYKKAAEFLLYAGETFSKTKNNIKYTLLDMYESADLTVSTYYPKDKILRSLVAIDYYLQHYIKPKECFGNIMPRHAKIQWLDSNGISHHQYRHVVLDLPFDWEEYTFRNTFRFQLSRITIEYDGKKAPLIIHAQRLQPIDID